MNYDEIERLSPEADDRDFEEFLLLKRDAELKLNHLNNIGKFALCSYIYNLLKKHPESYIEVATQIIYDHQVWLCGEKGAVENINSKIKSFLSKADFDLFLQQEDEMDVFINATNFYYFLHRFLGTEGQQVWLTEWEKAKIGKEINGGIGPETKEINKL